MIFLFYLFSCKIMKTPLYLRGRLDPCGTRLACPLTSNAIVFVLQYCQTDLFQLVFVTGDPQCDEDQFCCHIDLKVSCSLWLKVSMIASNLLQVTLG